MTEQSEAAHSDTQAERLRRIGQLCRSVVPVDRQAGRLCAVRQRARARPAGSLGRLDEMITRVAAVRGNPEPAPMTAVVGVLAADHGIARRQTSAFRPEVTSRLLELIQADQAPINVLAAQFGVAVVSADIGLSRPVGDQRYKAGSGTGDISIEDAMRLGQAEQAVLNGIRFADDHLADRPLVGVGEIGVGNTSATAALGSVLLDVAPDRMVGVGSGIDRSARDRKRQLVERAVERVQGRGADPLHLLAALGGYEIAGNVGVILAAAARRQVIVIDGSITTVSALLAARMCPAVSDYLVAAHRSTEPGHQLMLDDLGQPPLLSLDMRLGMASGAVLAIGLCNAALAVADATPAARTVGLVAP
ncbi:nicotinate-nucleotide--dimethylbenzimidazole phosphoribosyltransferase [Micromonospora sp. NPDC050187]|uniref:nicotinate-nucleotide--dimethylbenzimidazole phosphoribosyltransferase n=1 Tax=Micromonospora sp. NPDC050187 TaxID=3364277 RepID=UPI003798F069